MKLWSVLGNSQKLDGGAMFGNAPRALWERWVAVDAQNRIALYVRYTDLFSGKMTSAIKNKLLGD